MRVIVCVLAVLLSSPGVLAAVEDLRFERDEVGVNDHDARGQRTCVAAANRGGDDAAGCPRRPTTGQAPPFGVLVLDGYASLPAGVSDPREFPLEDPTTFTRTSPRSMNVQRTFAPEGPDVLPPGPAAFRAWFGQWDDADEDLTIDIVYDTFGLPRGPGNEWAPASASRTLYAYVEPGSHPSLADFDRPDESVPDFGYEASGVIWRGSVATPGEIKAVELGPVFLDGSLLQRYEVISVSDAVLIPGGAFPFTAGPDSLVDIDNYAAMAPAPVAGVYGAFAPLVNAVGSPGLSACPNTCRTGPVPLGETPAAAVVGPVEALVWAPYPKETDAGEGASSSGLLDKHRAQYAPWIDLLPGHQDSVYFERHLKGSNVPIGPGPLRGRDPDGRQAMAPGFMGFNAWVGVWKDINLDSWVGLASSPDPHENGSRPLGDRYDRPAGEFLGATATDSSGNAKATLTVTVTPMADWGPNGVYLCWMAVRSSTCLDSPTAHYTGTRPLTLTVTEDPTTRGLYVSTQGILFPEGTTHGGVVACVEGGFISQIEDGIPTLTPLRDCDTVGRYQAP